LKKILQIALTSLQESNGKGSSKRFTLLACVLFLAWIVIFHTDKSNAVAMAGILSGLIAGLAGVTAYHNIKSKSDN
tara:strand:+ start:257 stop:484 length:228 start_codon:yes stop_codon:yes gene_type:complete